MLEKVGKFKYNLHAGNSKVDDRQIIKVSEDKLATVLKALFGEDFKENPEDLIGQPLVKEGKKKCSKKLSKPKDVSEELKKTSAWAPIRNFDGTETNKVMGFDLDGLNSEESKPNYITFGTAEMGKFAEMRTQEDKDSGMFYTKRVDRFPDRNLTAEKAINMKYLKGKEPKKGMTGVVKVANYVTKPITIEKTAKLNRRYYIEASDGLTKYSFEVIRGIDDIVEGETRNSFFLPKNAEFIELGSVMEEAHDWDSVGIKKTANWVIASDNRFYFGGKDFEKYGQLGHNLENVSPFDAKWIMLQCGVSEGDMTKAASLKNGRFYFDKVEVPSTLSEYSRKVNEKLAEIFDPASDAELNLVKEAAVMEDRNTVDSLLSLNYINKDNLSEFIQSIPVIEQTLSILSRLLLAIRIGLKEIPEEAAKRAMYSLTKVLEKLYELGSYK
jgi:hypothetical protein